MDVTLLCRSCMSEMASWERENFDPSAVPQFTFCTNIEITDDGLPTEFCQECIVKIKSSYSYIKKAQDANIALKNLVFRTCNTMIIGIETDQQTEIDDKTAIDLNFDCDVKHEITYNSFLDNTDINTKTDQQTEVDDKTTIDLNFDSDVQNNVTDSPFLDNTDTNNDSDCALSDIKLVNDANALTNRRSNVTEQHLVKTESANVEKRESDYSKCENEKTGNMCQICFKVFNLEKSLKRHVIMAHQKRNIEEKGTIDEEDTNAQIKNETLKSKSKKSCEMCPICFKIFIHKKKLLRHINNRHPKKNVTEGGINKEEDEHPQIKNAHEYETKHNESKELIQCSMCDRTFTSKVWFTRHTERVHSKNVTVLPCSYCPESFRTSHQLVYHVDSAHPEHRQHACGACGKRFRKRKQLAAHAVVHGAARPHPCTKCDMVFKSSDVLAKHMKVHWDERPHLCDICGASFHLPGNLRDHVRIHTGAKPFACEQCSYRTATRGDLQRHARSHSKERSRPAVCGECGKGFYDRAGLTRHMRSHTGDRPYKCPFCTCAFVDSWKRRVHMLRAHALSRGDVPRLRRDGQVDTGCARVLRPDNVNSYLCNKGTK